MRFGVIYKATCLINGKAYIGKTVKQNPFLRIMEHGRSIERYPHILFYRALKKYGWDNFQWEVLCHEIPEDQLPKMEEFLIALHDTFDSGYNSTKGGEANPMDNPETRKKIKGRKHSEETKKKIADSGKGRKKLDETIKKISGKNNPNYGKPRPNETKMKISKSLRGENNPNYGKPMPDEVKMKISESLSGNKNRMFGKQVPNETKKKISESLKGDKNGMFGKIHTDETKQKISAKNSKYIYKVIDPDGNTFVVKGLHQFCKDKNLHHSHAYPKSVGEVKRHKGYTIEILRKA